MDRKPSKPQRAYLKASAPPKRRVDLELRAGSLAHYEDPAYYTEAYGERVEDAEYYERLALRVGGPVLEYGAGNGRIALPLARRGLDVTCVDLSREMLADLRTRLRLEAPEVRARIRTRLGDMRTVRLAARFPLILCPFNTALHLYTRPDVERFLARVRAHLAPGGTFVVDLSVPVNEDLARDPGKAFKAPRFRHPTTRDWVRYEEHFDYDRARQILFVSMDFSPVGAPERAWMTPLAHRQFYPQEFEALLHYNGFEVVRLEGDWRGGPFDRFSEFMIWHARLRSDR